MKSSLTMTAIFAFGLVYVVFVARGIASERRRQRENRERREQEYLEMLRGATKGEQPQPAPRTPGVPEIDFPVPDAVDITRNIQAVLWWRKRREQREQREREYLDAVRRQCPPD